MGETRSIAEELAALRTTVERMNQLVTEFLVNRPTRTQQARKLGVHRNTLYRREKKARLQLLANGRL